MALGLFDVSRRRRRRAVESLYAEVMAQARQPVLFRDFGIPDTLDGRFDALKPDFARFLMTWTLQGLWVFLTFACGLVAMTTPDPVSLGWPAAIGASMIPNARTGAAGGLPDSRPERSSLATHSSGRGSPDPGALRESAHRREPPPRRSRSRGECPPKA